MGSLIAATREAQPAEQRLFERHRSGDEAAREELLTRYLPLAKRLARRYGRSSEPLDDLQQVASLGLLKAIDRYDPSRGTAFASFALPTILGELRRYFRDFGWSIHVPRGTQELALRVQRAQEQLATAERAPTVDQLAEYLELDREEILDALEAVEAYETLSLDAPCPSDDGDNVMSFVETFGGDDDCYDRVELHASLSGALGQLDERERAVVRLRFVEDLSQTQIAARIGVSQMQVSRLLRRALERLRTSQATVGCHE
jgi:RNA polymerase sigma-B factor